MTQIVRLPLRQFEKLELLVRYPYPLSEDGRFLLDRGFKCLESGNGHFIFIYANSPEDDSPGQKYWEKTFKNKTIVDGKIIQRKGKRFVCMPLSNNK